MKIIDFYREIEELTKNKIIMQGWLYGCEDNYIFFCLTNITSGTALLLQGVKSPTAVQPAMHNYFVFSLNIICWSDLPRSSTCSTLFSWPLNKKLSAFIKLSSDA